MTKIRLQIPCPVCIDMNITKSLRNARIITWNHAVDDGALYIDETGMIHCQACGEEWFIGDSSWGCRDHSDRDELDYRTAPIDVTAMDVSKASFVLRDKASIWWWDQLVEKIHW